VVVLAKLLSGGGRRPTMAKLGADLSLSSSQIHSSLRRLEKSRLISGKQEGGRPLLQPVEEFLIHGVKYAFPAQRGEITRGIPTAYAAPPLSAQIAAGSDPPPVWPAAEGKIRGTTLEPLHKMVPAAALKDPTLYELLALIDALRDGRTRERQISERELKKRLQSLLHD